MGRADRISTSETSPLLRSQCHQPPPSPPSSGTAHWRLAALLLYFAAGVAFYACEEGMPAMRAVYFCMITFTTVGFGDSSPSTAAGKLFTCLFVFVGLAIIATLVSDLLDHIIEQREKVKTTKLHDAFDRQDIMLKSGEESDDLGECFTLLPVEIPPFAVPILQGMKQSFLIIALNILIGVLFFSFFVDNYSLIDAFYLSCMTITTVGYGDITPSNNNSRVFTIVYALLGTIVTGNALSKFASAISDYKQAKLEAMVLARPLNHDSLRAMDVDADSRVSKEEFVLYKLRVMGALDDDIVQRAEAQFHRLDVTKSGYLSVEDIVLFEKKLKNVGRNTRVTHTSSADSS